MSVRASIALSAAALTTFAGLACADPLTETHVVTFDKAGELGTLDVPLFDTMGSTRELISVTLLYDQTVSIGIYIEQNSPVNFPFGEFFLDAGFNTFHILGPDFGAPEVQLGGVFNTYTPAIAPTDGINRSGPDSAIFTDSTGAYSAGFSFDDFNDPTTRDVFIGTGMLTTMLGGFTDAAGGFVNDPNFPMVDPENPPQMPDFIPPFFPPYYDVFYQIESPQHVGSLTIIYSYETVAAPCVGDIADDFGVLGNDDGIVSFGDFLALLGLIGPCPGNTPGCTGDIADDFGVLGNEDAQVSFGDFLALLGLLGPCA